MMEEGQKLKSWVGLDGMWLFIYKIAIYSNDCQGN
jgi:hypothetical protein